MTIHWLELAEGLAQAQAAAAARLMLADASAEGRAERVVVRCTRRTREESGGCGERAGVQGGRGMHAGCAREGRWVSASGI